MVTQRIREWLNGPQNPKEVLQAAFDDPLDAKKTEAARQLVKRYPLVLTLRNQKNGAKLFAHYSTDLLRVFLNRRDDEGKKQGLPQAALLTEWLHLADENLTRPAERALMPALDAAIDMCAWPPEYDAYVAEMLPRLKSFGWNPSLPVYYYLNGGDRPHQRYTNDRAPAHSDDVFLALGDACDKPATTAWLLKENVPVYKEYENGCRLTALREVIQKFNSVDKPHIFLQQLAAALPARGIAPVAYFNEGEKEGSSAYIIAARHLLGTTDEKVAQEMQQWLSGLIRVKANPFAEFLSDIDGHDYRGNAWEIAAAAMHHGRDIKRPDIVIKMQEKAYGLLLVGMPVPVKEAREICGEWAQAVLQAKRKEGRVRDALYDEKNACLTDLATGLTATGLMHHAYIPAEWNNDPAAFHDFLQEKIAPLLTAPDQKRALEESMTPFRRASVPQESWATRLGRYLSGAGNPRER